MEFGLQPKNLDSPQMKDTKTLPLGDVLNFSSLLASTGDVSSNFISDTSGRFIKTSNDKNGAVDKDGFITSSTTTFFDDKKSELEHGRKDFFSESEQDLSKSKGEGGSEVNSQFRSVFSHYFQSFTGVSFVFLDFRSALESVIQIVKGTPNCGQEFVRFSHKHHDFLIDVSSDSDNNLVLKIATSDAELRSLLSIDANMESMLAFLKEGLNREDIQVFLEDTQDLNFSSNDKQEKDEQDTSSEDVIFDLDEVGQDVD